MELDDIIKDRYSVRNFSDKEIDDTILSQLLNTINYVPTAKNIQPVKVYVLRSKESLDKIRSITKSAYNAPCVLLFTCSEDAWVNPYSNNDSKDIDSAITATYLMLKAHDLGLSSVFVCWFDPVKIRNSFNIDKSEKIVSLLPIGYKNEDALPSESHTIKKDIKTIVKYL